MREATHNTRTDRIAERGKDNRDGRRSLLDGAYRQWPGGYDHVRIPGNEFGSKLRQALGSALGRKTNIRNSLPFDISEFAHAFHKGREQVLHARVKKADLGNSVSLCAGVKWPRSRAANKTDKFPPPHVDARALMGLILKC